jgi:hypothetical protein
MTAAEIALAEALLTQGLQFWASFQAKKASGTLTMTDVATVATQVGVDLATLAADIAAANPTPVPAKA